MTRTNPGVTTMNCLSRTLTCLFVAALLTGCGDSKPTPPSDDPETIKRLEEQQKKGRSGEK